MKCFAAASFILLLSLFTANALAQNAPPPSGAPPFGDYKTHLPGLEDKRYPDMIRRNMIPRPTFGPTPEPRVLKKGRLAPARQDRETYAIFLRQPDTGLIRLLPAELNPKKDSRSGRLVTGPYYSFLLLMHGYDGDIKLDREAVCRGVIGGPPDCQYPRKLSVGRYGMLTTLGDAALDQITTNDSRVTFLAAYEPPQTEQKVRCEILELQKGMTVNGQVYKSGLPIQINQTYLLRATDHRRSDVLVAFRVVREDADGSVTLAWKLLKEFKPRKIENVLYVNSIDTCPTK